MNYKHLGMIFFLSLQSLCCMESPLSVLASEADEQIGAQMLAKVPTSKHAHELLNASRVMLKEHGRFLDNMAVLAQVPAILKEIRLINLPQLTQWKKDLVEVEQSITLSLIGSVEYCETFDQTLDTSDGTVSHEANIALRQRYTQSFTAKNKELEKHKADLQMLINKLKTVPLQRLYKKEELKTNTEQYADPEEEFIYLWKYKKFIEDYLPAQDKLCHIVSQMRKKLGIQNPLDCNYAYTDKDNIADELSTYCSYRCDILERILKKTKGEKELKALIDSLESKHRAALDSFKICAQGKSAVLAIPTWKTDIPPLTVAQIQQLKSEYKYWMPFSLSEPLKARDGSRESHVLYFFSKGKAAKYELHTTPLFAFSVGSKIQICEQLQNNKVKSHTLCFKASGKYYFVDAQLPGTAKAYKIDYVGALSFAKQQTP